MAFKINNIGDNIPGPFRRGRFPSGKVKNIFCAGDDVHINCSSKNSLFNVIITSTNWILRVSVEDI